MQRTFLLGRRPYQFLVYVAAQFILFTLAAMAVYPGGTLTDPTTSGYSFSRNFFSDLGLFIAHNGEPNTISAGLFFVALAGAGLGLVWFFIAVAAGRTFNQSPFVRGLSWIGSIFGVITGIAFMGVAFTPADMFPGMHAQFVLTAFRTFLIVVLCYAFVIWRQRNYPTLFAGIYLIFAAALAAYINLLLFGPSFASEQGLVTQAVGQKLIVYIAIGVMLIQGMGMLRYRDLLATQALSVQRDMDGAR